MHFPWKGFLLLKIKILPNSFLGSVYRPNGKIHSKIHPNLLVVLWDSVMSDRCLHGLVITTITLLWDCNLKLSSVSAMSCINKIWVGLSIIQYNKLFEITITDTNYVLSSYKTEACKRPPRLCRQGYACPQYHNSRDKRRSPRKFKYRYVGLRTDWYFICGLLCRTVIH